MITWYQYNLISKKSVKPTDTKIDEKYNKIQMIFPLVKYLVKVKKSSKKQKVKIVSSLHACNHMNEY